MTPRLVPFVLLTIGAIAATGTPRQGANTSSPSIADVAVRVARSGFSGGFVLRLPPQLETAFKERTDSSSAFRFWFSRAIVGLDASQPASISQIDDNLRRHAASPNGSLEIESASTHRTAKDPRASACASRLSSVLVTPVEGTHILEVLARTAASARAAPEPRGAFVGSCLGTNQFSTRPVRVDAAITLESALNQIVEGFGGSVWVAIQSGPDLCSLGLILRAEGGGVCTTDLAQNLGPLGK